MASLQPVQFEIGGRKYSTIPLTGFDVLDLNRIVDDMWSRMVENVRSRGIAADDKTAVMSAMTDALSSELAHMSKEEYRNLVEMTLSSTTLIGGAKEKDTRLSNADIVGDAFAGHLVDLPNVLVEVWSANKLSPFA